MSVVRGSSLLVANLSFPGAQGDGRWHSGGISSLGSKELATVTHIETPARIFIRPAKDENLYEDVGMKLRQFCEETQGMRLAILQQSKGAVIGLKFGDLWHRLEVLDVTQNEASFILKGFFLDSGRTEEIQLSNDLLRNGLRKLPERITQVPPLAICCGIRGLESEWYEESQTEGFKHILSALTALDSAPDQVNVEVVAKLSPTFIVEMYSAKSRKDIGETARTLLQLDEQSSVELVSPCVTPKREEVHEKEKSVLVRDTSDGVDEAQKDQSEVPTDVMPEEEAIVLKGEVYDEEKSFEVRDTSDGVKEAQKDQLEVAAEVMADESLVPEVVETVVEGLPPMRVRIGPERKLGVIVSHIEKVDCIYAQPADQTEDIEQLVKEIGDFYEGNNKKELVDNPEIGNICVARFSEDMQWYRGMITALPDEKNMNVRFVDYGNSEVVERSDVMVLTDEFKNRPPFAIRFSLAGILDSPDIVKKLSGALIGPNKKVFVKLVESGEECWTVDFEIVEQYGKEVISVRKRFGEADVDGMMVECERREETETPSSDVGRLEEEEKKAPCASRSDSGLSVSPPARSDSALEAQSKEEGMKLEGTPLKDRKRSVSRDSGMITTDGAPVEATAQFSLARIRAPVGVKLEAMVSQFDNCDLFFLGLKKHDNSFELVAEELGKAWPSRKPLESVRVGALCMAQYEKEPYRAEVTEIWEGTVKIFFVDFGNTDDRPKEELFKLPPSLENIPKLCIPCCLGNVGPAGESWSQEAEDELYNLLTKGGDENETDVSVTFLEEDDGERTCPVDIRKPELKQSVAEKFVATGMAVKKIPVLMYSGFEAVEVGATEEVMISEIVDPSLFFARVTRNNAICSEIDDTLDAMQSCKKVLAFPSIGQACAAEISGTLVRAEILSVTEEGDSATVTVVDYGYDEAVSANRLFEIPEKLVSIPKQALSCRVADVYPGEGEDWPEGSKERFKKGIENRKVELDFVNKLEEGSYEVDVMVDGTELWKTLIGMGYGDFVHKRFLAPETTDSGREEREVSETVPEEDEDWDRSAPPPTIPQADPLPLTKQELCAVVPLEPFTFYALPDAFQDKLTRIQELVVEVLKKEGRLPVEGANIGDVFLADFEGYCYRCEVTKLYREEGELEVEFVDYGNKTRKKLTEVFKIPEAYADRLRQPRSSIACELWKLKVSEDCPERELGKNWEREALKMDKVVLAGRRKDGVYAVEDTPCTVQILAHQWGFNLTTEEMDKSLSQWEEYHEKLEATGYETGSRG